MLDAELFGIDLNVAELHPGEVGAGLWPEHVPAATAFLRVQNQWRSASCAEGGHRFLGLDYNAVHSGFKMAGVTTDPALWADVQVIEAAACAALNGESR